MASVVDWDEFLPYVEPEVELAPLVLMRQKLIDAAREFCAGTLLWKVESGCTPIITVANQRTYALGAPATFNAVIEKVLSMRIGSDLDNMFPEERSQEELDRDVRDWRAKTCQAGEYQHYVRVDEATFALYPFLAAGGVAETIAIKAAALKPALSSTQTMDTLLEYAEQIGYGAKWRLMEMPGKKWSNAKQADYYKRHFKHEIRLGHARASKSFQRGGEQIRSPFKFA